MDRTHFVIGVSEYTKDLLPALLFWKNIQTNLCNRNNIWEIPLRNQKTMNCKFWFCNKFHLLFHSHCLIGVMVLFDKIQFTPCLSPFWFIFFSFRCCQSNWITGKTAGIWRSTSAQATIPQKSASEWVLYCYSRGMGLIFL